MMLSFLALLFLAAQASSRLESLVRGAEADLQSRRYAEAKVKLEQAVRLDNRNAAIWSYLGVARANLSEIDSAITAFQKALAILPTNAQNCFNVASLYWRKGDAANAARMYDKGLALKPEDPEANRNYGALLAQSGRCGEAAPRLRKAKAANASDLAVRATLIDCLLKSGLAAEAKAETEELLGLGLGSADERVSLGVMLAENARPDLAIEVLDNTIQKNPSAAGAFSLLGLLYSSRNRHEEAVRALARAVQLDPASAKYSLALAQALLEWKHYGPALEFLRAVEPRFGTLPEFRYTLGLTCYALRQFSDAIAALENLQDAQTPRQELALFYLGNSYLEIREFRKAESCYRKALQLDPKEASYHLGMGLLLRRQGDDRLDEATGYLEKAVALDRSNVEAKLQLALCLERKGQLARAEALLEESVRLRPDLMRAHIALVRVYKLRDKQDQVNQEKAIIARLKEEEQKTGFRLPAPTDDDPPDIAIGLGAGRVKR